VLQEERIHKQKQEGFQNKKEEEEEEEEELHKQKQET
jgi:hypothetical protein